MPPVKPTLYTSVNREATAVAPIRKAGSTRTVKVIDAGWGSSGYYSPDVLRESAAKALPANTHMYINHPSAQEQWDRPERSIEHIVGVLQTEAAWDDNGPDGPGCYAQMSVRPSMEAMVDELADYIGVSIHCMMATEWGEGPDGREGPIVQELIAHPMNSVDLVTHAGRGGAILQGAESAELKAADAVYLLGLEAAVPSPPQTPAVVPAPAPKKGFKMADLTEEGARALAESQTALATEMRLAREAAATSKQEPTVSPIQAAVKLTEALATSGIPADSHKRVLEDVSAGMAPDKAIERWKTITDEITAAKTASTGTESHVHEVGGNVSTGTESLSDMFTGLGGSYGVKI